MTIKKVLTLFIAICMVLGTMSFTVFAAETTVSTAVDGLTGAGTAADPYLINNLDDLKWFRNSVNTYTSDGSNQYKGKYVKLTADIDLNGENWTPIGTNSVGDHMAFLGTFDGDGHTISNLYVNGDGGHLGFFARVGSYAEGITPTVANITFDNVDVYSNTTTGHDGSYVGGVIANAGGNSVVSNVHIKGYVYVEGYGYVGGIVGHGYPDIDNCSVVAEDGSYINAHYWCVGGIIGYAGEGGTPITNSSVEGVDIWGAYGGAGAVAGLLQDGNKISNIVAKNVEVSGGDYYSGYIAGNGSASTLTNITVENVTADSITATDVIAKIGDSVYFNLSDAVAAAQANDTIVIHKDIDDTFALTAPAVAPLTFKAATDGIKVTGRVLLPRTAVSGVVTYEGFDFSDNTDWTVYQWDGDEQLADLELVFRDCNFGTKGICIGFDYNKENWNLKKLTLDNCTAPDKKEVFSLQYVSEVVIKNCDFSNATDRLINVSAASGDVVVDTCDFGAGAIQLSQNIGTEERNLTVENSTFTGEKAVVIHENLTNASTPIGTIELVDNTVEETTEIVNFKDDSVEADVYLANTEVTFNGNKTADDTEVKEVSNGYGVADGIVVRLPSADISGAYIYNKDNGQPETDEYRENIQVDLTDVYATNSLEVKTYSGDKLLATTSLKTVDDENTVLFPVNVSVYSANIVLKGKPAGSWTTEWHITPNADLVPDKFEVYADGILSDTYEGLVGIDTNGNEVGGEAAYNELSALADYYLVFETYDGSEIMTLMLDEDMEFDLSDYTPTREGYTFDGWYEDEALTRRVRTITLSHDTTIYAKWEKDRRAASGGSVAVVKYTLSFEANGGTAVASVSKFRNTTVDLSKYITTRDGYSFDGWYTDEELTEKAAKIKMTKDTVLYAKWVGGDDGDKENEENPNYKPDIMSEEHYAYIVGRDGGYIYPDKELTRAEAATIFFRLLSEDVRSEGLTKQNTFSDVNEDDWFNTAVSTLANLEVLSGRTADTFAPNEPITRAELTTIVARLSEASYTGADLFSDISGHWAREYINIAASINWVNGENGLFRPDDNITRAEVVTLVNRALNRLPETKDDLCGDMFTAEDNSDVEAWYYLAIQEASNSHTCEIKDDGKHEKWTALTENPDWTMLEK